MLTCQTISELTRDLEREVYCLFGLPVDRITIGDTVSAILKASRRDKPFLLTTPNLNFAVTSQSDEILRESVISSDLSTPDGMPLVWCSKLLGIPLRERVSGSDIFQELKQLAQQPLRICFFGGAPGIGKRACQLLNAEAGRVTCAGAIDPGAGSMEDMCRPEIIAAVNATKADFLAVALGAQKGQAWLLRNHRQITIPVRGHLGAVINFQAGSIARAPLLWQKNGLEWLWRIKEEPFLWRRYWRDGRAFLKLLVSRIGPLMWWNRIFRLRAAISPRELRVKLSHEAGGLTVVISGDALNGSLSPLIEQLKKTLNSDFECLFIDLSDLRGMDQRFLGLLLVTRKILSAKSARMALVGITPRVRWLFGLNGCAFLLAPR